MLKAQGSFFVGDATVGQTQGDFAIAFQEGTSRSIRYTSGKRGADDIALTGIKPLE